MTIINVPCNSTHKEFIFYGDNISTDDSKVEEERCFGKKPKFQTQMSSIPTEAPFAVDRRPVLHRASFTPEGTPPVSYNAPLPEFSKPAHNSKVESCGDTLSLLLNVVMQILLHLVIPLCNFFVQALENTLVLFVFPTLFSLSRVLSSALAPILSVFEPAFVFLLDRTAAVLLFVLQRIPYEAFWACCSTFGEVGAGLLGFVSWKDSPSWSTRASEVYGRRTTYSDYVMTHKLQKHGGASLPLNARQHSMMKLFRVRGSHDCIPDLDSPSSRRLRGEDAKSTKGLCIECEWKPAVAFPECGHKVYCEGCARYKRSVECEVCFVKVKSPRDRSFSDLYDIRR